MVKKLLPGSEPLFIEGSKTGVLLLHGFTSTPYEMKPLAKYLESTGYSISIPLLKGHGTRPEDLLECKWYDWFEDTKKALFQLRKHCTKIIAVGLSTGATLALHLAAHYQLEGVAGLSPALILKEKKLKLLPLALHVKKYSHKKGGPDISDPIARQQAVTYHKTPLRSVREILHLYAHLKMDLPDIYTPVLLIQSQKDHVVDMKSAEFIYDKISSTEKHFLKLKESYHVLTLDVEKEIVFREVASFIQRCVEPSED